MQKATGTATKTGAGTQFETRGGGVTKGCTHISKSTQAPKQVRTDKAENRGTVSKAGRYTVPNAGGTVENKDGGTQRGHTVRYPGGGGIGEKGMGIHNAKMHGGAV